MWKQAKLSTAGLGGGGNRNGNKINFIIEYLIEAACLSALLVLNFIKAAVVYNPLINKAWGHSLEIDEKHYFPWAKEQRDGKDPTISS